jgi:hypothetical protein
VKRLRSGYVVGQHHARCCIIGGVGGDLVDEWTGRWWYDGAALTVLLARTEQEGQA